MADEGPRHDETVLTAKPAEQALASALRAVFTGLRVLMVVVLVALVFSNTRFLQQNERAIILRFGEITGKGTGKVHGPGLVFAWPQPINELVVVDAGRVHSIQVDDFMYRKAWRDQPGLGARELFQTDRDGYALTRDANIIHTLWQVQYQIDDVVDYALNVKDPEDLLRKSLAAAVVHSCAEFSVEQALWEKPSELRARVRKRLQERLNDAGSGIKIVGEVNTVVLREPKQTEGAFLSARQALIERGKEKEAAGREAQALLANTAGAVGPELNAALTKLVAAEEAPEDERDPEAIEALREEVDGLLGKAGGEVSTILSAARTYSTRVESEAKAMAETFEALDHEYRENPAVFVREMYRSTIEEVMSKAGVKFLFYPRERVIRIVLEPRQKKPPEAKEPIVVKTPEERQRESMPGG